MYNSEDLGTIIGRKHRNDPVEQVRQLMSVVGPFHPDDPAAEIVNRDGRLFTPFASQLVDELLDLAMAADSDRVYGIVQTLIERNTR